MKKILLLLAVFAFVGTTAQAQCTKSAAYTSKKSCSKSTAVKVADAEKKTCTKAADAAMVGNLNIVKKVNDTTGEVSYARKNTCAASGKVSYEDVKYCSKSQAFVNVAPADAATAITVASAEKKVCSKSVAAALTANPDVEKRTCAASGKVSYMQKKTCAASGKVSYNEVKYCADSKKFVNAAPAKKSCSAAQKAACTKSKAACTKSASAKGVSLSADGAKKSCAKTGKTCTKGKKASANVQPVQSDVKVIKTSNQ